MLTAQDHETFKAVFRHPEVAKGLRRVETALLKALASRGIPARRNGSSTKTSRTDVRVCRRFKTTAVAGLSLELRTLALPEGLLVAYLVAIGNPGPRKSFDAAQVEVFRTPHVPNWRAFVDAVTRLTDAICASETWTRTDWGPAADAATARIEDQLAH